MMPQYRFSLLCMRCNKTAEHVSEYKEPPRITCGECLMDRRHYDRSIPIVDFVVIGVVEEPA